MWPHIHFIPRHDGDAHKIGGMRHAHPGADHKNITDENKKEKEIKQNQYSFLPMVERLCTNNYQMATVS